MQAASKHLVFVFGTLKENFPNHHKNTGVRQPGSFCTRDRYPLYLVGERHSPWLLEQPGVGHRVTGEVFEVTNAGLAAMNALERVGERDGYHRTAVSISRAAESRRSAGLLGPGAEPWFLSRTRLIRASFQSSACLVYRLEPF